MILEVNLIKSYDTDYDYPREPPEIKFIGNWPKLNYIDEKGQIIKKKLKILNNWSGNLKYKILLNISIDYWENSFVQIILIIIALEAKNGRDGAEQIYNTFYYDDEE